MTVTRVSGLAGRGESEFRNLASPLRLVSRRGIEPTARPMRSPQSDYSRVVALAFTETGNRTIAGPTAMCCKMRRGEPREVANPSYLGVQTRQIADNLALSASASLLLRRIPWPVFPVSRI